MKPKPEIAPSEFVAARHALLAMALAVSCGSVSALPPASSGPVARTTGGSTAVAGTPSGAPPSAGTASVGADLPEPSAYGPSGRPAPAADGLHAISASAADIDASSLASGAQRVHAVAASRDVAGQRTPVPVAPEPSGLDRPDAGTFVVLLVTALAVIAFVASRRED